LPGDELGRTAANRVALDVTAAGRGWFVDATPGDDSEYVSVAAGLRASDDRAAHGVDLLTVVLHEFGHLLGLEDLSADALAEDLMQARLGIGIRRLPTAATIERLA
jgi:hypothetical protein